MRYLHEPCHRRLLNLFPIQYLRRAQQRVHFNLAFAAIEHCRIFDGLSDKIYSRIIFVRTLRSISYIHEPILAQRFAHDECADRGGVPSPVGRILRNKLQHGHRWHIVCQFHHKLPQFHIIVHYVYVPVGPDENSS